MNSSPTQYYNNIDDIFPNNSNNLLGYQIRTNVIRESSYSYLTFFEVAAFSIHNSFTHTNSQSESFLIGVEI